jgi:hypothetical protein
LKFNSTIFSNIILKSQIYRAFTLTWPKQEIVQGVIAQFPWRLQKPTTQPCAYGIGAELTKTMDTRYS